MFSIALDISVLHADRRAALLAEDAFLNQGVNIAFANGSLIFIFDAHDTLSNEDLIGMLVVMLSLRRPCVQLYLCSVSAARWGLESLSWTVSPELTGFLHSPMYS